MSETQGSTHGPSSLSQEQIDDVSGGFCSARELEDLLGGLKQNYETLVDTVSHIIERVAGK